MAVPSLGLSRRSWPRGTIDLLLRAALAPADEARRAWRGFLAVRDFEDITWHEIRLVAALSGRMGEIDPQSPLRPRIDGLAKQLWTQTQLLLGECADAFDLLAGAGVPFLVIKGGAQYAEGLGAPARRIMGDIALLVRPEHAVAAIDALSGGGWAGVNGESPELLRSTAATRLSTNFRKGERGDVNLHIDPFHYARRDEGLTAALWGNARLLPLAQRRVPVPEPTDAVLIALAHAAVSESGDWAIDLSTRIAGGQIDWPRLLDLASRRGLVPAVRSGLLYLSEALSLPVPQDALAALGRAPATVAERLKYWANVRGCHGRNLAEKAVNRLANRMLDGRGYTFIVKDRRAITVTRPRAPLRWTRGLGRPIDGLSQDRLLDHACTLDGVAGRRRLVLELAVVRPPESRRLFFDVTANDVAVARLRARAGGKRAGEERRLVFALRLPAADDGGCVRVRVLARPIGYVTPKAAETVRAKIEPVPFRLVNAWVI